MRALLLAVTLAASPMIAFAHETALLKCGPHKFDPERDVIEWQLDFDDRMTATHIAPERHITSTFSGTRNHIDGTGLRFDGSVAYRASLSGQYPNLAGHMTLPNGDDVRDCTLTFYVPK